MHISGQKFIYPHFLIPKLNGVVHKIVRRVTMFYGFEARVPLFFMV